MKSPQDMLADYLDLLLADPLSTRGAAIAGDATGASAEVTARPATDSGAPAAPLASHPAAPSSPPPGPLQRPASAVTPGMQEDSTSYRMCWAAGLAVALPECHVASVLPAGILRDTRDTADCVIGQCDTALGVRKVVDLPMLLGRGQAQRGSTFVVLLNHPWVLAVDKADAVVRFAPGTLRWRTDEQRAQKRAWLAGMAMDPSCALLDLAGLYALLSEYGVR